MAATWVQDWAWAFTTGAWALWALAAVILWVALLKDRSRGRRRCPKCWYDMTGVPGLKCPECGREARREKRLFSTRRRWRLAAFGVALALVGIASHRAPTALRHGVWAAVPIPVLNFVLGFWEEEAKALYEQDFAAMEQSGGWTAVPPSRTTWQRLLIASAVQEIPKRPIGDLSLASRQSYTHEALVESLGLEMRPAIPVLEREALTQDPDHAIRAAHLLLICAASGGLEAIDVLREAAARSESADVRRDAVRKLAMAVTITPEARRALHRVVIECRDDATLPIATTALVTTLTDSRAGRRTLAWLLDHPMNVVRLAAIEGCASTPAGWHVHMLCQRLQSDPDEHTRAAIASIAHRAGNGDFEWLSALRVALLDSSAIVRRNAAASFAFIALQSGEGPAQIENALGSCEDPAARGVLLIALVSDLPTTVDCVARLWRALEEDRDPVIQAIAMRALVLHSSEHDKLVGPAIGSLESLSHEQQLAALNVLGRMGPLAAAALDRIRELESSPDPRIAAAARDAREKIEVAPR